MVFPERFGYGESELFLEFGRQNEWHIIFTRRVRPTTVRWQFQAGFAAEPVRSMTKREELELKDIHDTQSFEIRTEKSIRKLTFVFEECTDFYNRVIVYQLQVPGSEEPT